MPDDQGQVITPTTPNGSADVPPADQPITVGYEPKPAAPADDMPLMAAPIPAPAEVSKPTSISITIQDESGPAQSAPVSNPAPPPAEPTPSITPPVGPETPASPVTAQPADVPPTLSPDMGQDNLQSKINSHPLFSGVKDKPLPRQSKAKKWLLWSAVFAAIVIIGGYLAIDSGLVRGASHLPFHIFKQATPAPQPVIHTQQTTSSSSQTTTTDPYAGWKTYSSTAGQFSLKYPSTWVIPDNLSSCSDGLLLLAPDSKSLGKCATEGFGEVSFVSVAGNQSASYAIKTSDGYTGVTTDSVTVQSVSGTKYTAIAQGQQDKPGVGTLPDNTKVVVYVFYTGGKTYVATYNQTPSYPDVLSDFTNIVTATFKFSS